MTNKTKKYTSAISEVSKVSYVLYRRVSSFDSSEPYTYDDLHCARCHKTVTEIGRDKLDKHLKDHDKNKK